MKVYALMGEENDSHDVGTHLEVVELESVPDWLSGVIAAGTPDLSGGAA
jgi:hypothetical protein